MRRQSLDKTDIAIIGHLQVDGRRAYTTIAKDLGISEASVRQRVARLLRTNIIQIVAVSSPLDLGLMWAQIHLRVKGDRIERVAEAVAELPQVDYVSICAGDFDIIVGVVALPFHIPFFVRCFLLGVRCGRLGIEIEIEDVIALCR